MEIKDIRKVEEALKDEIDAMGKSPDRDILAREKCVPIIKQELELVLLKSVQNLYYMINGLPVIKLDAFYGKNLKDLKTINDYQYNMKIIENIIGDEKRKIKLLKFCSKAQTLISCTSFPYKDIPCHKIVVKNGEVKY